MTTQKSVDDLSVYASGYESEGTQGMLSSQSPVSPNVESSFSYLVSQSDAAQDAGTSPTNVDRDTARQSKSRARMFGLIGAIVLVAAGLAIGLGVGLTVNRNSSNTTAQVVVGGTNAQGNSTLATTIASGVGASATSTTTIAPSSTSPATTTAAASPSPDAGARPLKNLDVIRGVNIGGWIVVEAYINPKLFTLPNGTRVRDEWTLCSVLGKEASTALFENHYNTFITEDDIRQISDAGLNLIRIPVNYWAINAVSSEPYPENIGWKYVDRVLGWARKYGLNVKFDLHSAPGNQNPWGLSGREGFFDWQFNSDKYFNRTTATLEMMIQAIAGPNYTHVKYFELLNEPTLYSLDATNKAKVYGWYAEVLGKLRGILSDRTRYPSGGPALGINDGFEFLNVLNGQTPTAAGLGDIFMDFHFYSMFTLTELQLSWQDRMNYACTTWAGELSTYNRTRAPTMVGEFSAAYTDCTQYLNGMYENSRSDGTYLASPYPNTCNCTCLSPEMSDYRVFTPAKKALMRQWAETQMDMAEKNGIGWVYWTWKIEDDKAPDFNYKLGLENG
ncbi:exo-1,3-beta-glucanase, partial [Gonapodya sp. JEL0774]